MRQRNKCRWPGCTARVIDTGARMCEKHLEERMQCTGIVKEYDKAGNVVSERRCKRTATAGLEVCSSHGGSAPKLRAQAERTSALTAMQRFVQPFKGDLDPISAFELEFRRTYGRILWLEEQIAELDDEALTWGLTKEEHITATEFSGTNTTHEARIHVYEEMLRWERKHFLDLEKVWIGAKLDEKRLAIMRDHIDYTYVKVTEAARALGHDPADPDVRAVLMSLFSRSIGDGSPTALPRPLLGPQSDDQGLA